MYHSSKLTIEYIVIIRTVIYKKEYNNITVNSSVPAVVVVGVLVRVQYSSLMNVI